MAKKKTETVVVTWRVKEALRRRLESAATHNEISVNAEITRRIEESFSRESLVDLQDKVQKLMGSIIGRLETEARVASKDPTLWQDPDELQRLYEIRLEETRHVERQLLTGLKRLRDERGTGQVHEQTRRQAKGDKP
jgi:hypothetical protein